MEEIMDTRHGVYFSDEYQEYLKSQFSYADADPEYGHRLFFEIPAVPCA